MTVPLLDLQAQHAEIRAELDAAIGRVFAHGRFVGGPEIGEFEAHYAAFCGVEHCIGVANGTEALTLGLRAAGVGPGNEVITTTFTFLATVESIFLVGARPILVDPRSDTALMHVDDVEAAVTERTAAIVAVHLYGQTVDLDAFRALADRRGLLLVEDAAQAHGAAWNVRTAGSVGDFATFSFFPGKNLGAVGDAGALTTADSQLAERLASLRDHGRSDKYVHDSLGTNARLDTLQAAVLDVKLAHLAGWNEARRRHAAAYDAALSTIEGLTPIVTAQDARPVYHQYVIRLAERDRARALLADHGIETGVHYPVPLHRQPALAATAGGHDLPVSERLADEVLSLPVYPELTADDRTRIIDLLAEHAAATRSVPAETSA
jgi:dTDP-4-amino-4,6-dideoxygalactose transaminase